MTRRRVALALAALALAALAGVTARCNLFVKTEDCGADSDCAAGQRCNVPRRFCYVPPVELCNGRDDDVDGVADADEDFGRCTPDLPPGTRGCRDGVRRCVGTELVCERRTEPAPSEACGNGVDDDCNGVIDDGADCTVNYPATMNMIIGSNDPAAGEGDDAPAHEVCLDAFSIDRYEVTFEAYVTFLSSLDQSRITVGTPPRPMNGTVAYGRYVLYEDRGEQVPLLLVPPQPGPLSIDRLPYGFALHDENSRNLPVVNVTWLGAQRYCDWAGKHLPTEAEFFRAARGARGTRPFPWGAEAPSCARANLGIGGPDGGACSGRPAPVGSIAMGANPEGVFELYGNVNEWMHDFLDTNPSHSRNNYYQSLAPDAWCGAFPRGPTGPDAGSPIAQPEDAGLYCVECRFARGRHYRTVDPRIGIRRWLDADRGEPFVGFRCSQGGAPR